jgi:hypothetical protein
MQRTIEERKIGILDGWTRWLELIPARKFNTFGDNTEELETLSGFDLVDGKRLRATTGREDVVLEECHDVRRDLFG